jgi:hypothetical protein
MVRRRGLLAAGLALLAVAASAAGMRGCQAWARAAQRHVSLRCLGTAGAPTYELLGYEEGSSKTVQCKGSGYFTGIELSFATASGFSEKVANGLRLRCST